MTDRELLELAAKAAGHEVLSSDDRAAGIYVWLPDTNRRPRMAKYWDPLTDDGDALRLAVKLKLDLRFPRDNDMYVDAGSCDAYTVYLIDEAGDRAAATRRAIVRAAAAIGGPHA